MYTRVYISFNHECIKFTYNLEYSIFETVELSIVQYTTCIPRLLLTLNTCMLPGIQYIVWFEPHDLGPAAKYRMQLSQPSRQSVAVQGIEISNVLIS